MSIQMHSAEDRALETGSGSRRRTAVAVERSVPRVAFFTDTFAEINGVALTSRELQDFALRRQYPFLCVRGSARTSESRGGSVATLELARGPIGFDLDKGLRHDLFLCRHYARTAAAIRAFGPDIIHVVSPGDTSELGVFLAKRMKIPLTISWHTNLHEFAAIRLKKLLGVLPPNLRASFTNFSEKQILSALMRFYRLGDVLYAPNAELVEMLEERTGKPVFLMKRGIDTRHYTPAKRILNDGILRLGYVGRITPEKNVRFLSHLENSLCECGAPPFRLLVVGDGSEREWLRSNLRFADMPGVLRGEELATAFANMDVFVFPSRTDTFGNVVLEAFASGVPAIVTDRGGPKFIVRDGVSGFVAPSENAFIDLTLRMLQDKPTRLKMARAAREQAGGESWDQVFETVYDGYDVAVEKKNRVR